MSHLKQMQDDPLTVEALKRIGNPDPNFMVHLYSWLGHGPNSVMQITGSLFREAKSGKRKGEVCIQVKGTEETVYLTSKEVQELVKKEKSNV